MKINHHLIKRLDHFWHILATRQNLLVKESIHDPNGPKTDILLTAINLK